MLDETLAVALAALWPPQPLPHPTPRDDVTHWWWEFVVWSLPHWTDPCSRSRLGDPGPGPSLPWWPGSVFEPEVWSVEDTRRPQIQIYCHSNSSQKSKMHRMLLWNRAFLGFFGWRSHINLLIDQLLIISHQFPVQYGDKWRSFRDESWTSFQPHFKNPQCGWAADSSSLSDDDDSRCLGRCCYSQNQTKPKRHHCFSKRTVTMNQEWMKNR